MTENQIAKEIVNKCYEIHSGLGAGLFESVYEEILSHELHAQNFEIKRQNAIPVVWKDIKLDLGFRADLIVNNKVIIEIKSVESIALVYKKQLLTYLKLTGIKLGLLVNFNEALIKDGISRVVNKL